MTRLILFLDFTTKHLENNILAQDNSATPNLRHSQMHSIRSMDNDGLTYSLRDPEPPTSDWLTCIATKTGIPKLVLSLVIFLCAVMMIWLCLTAAVTGPDQKVKSQVCQMGARIALLLYLSCVEWEQEYIIALVRNVQIHILYYTLTTIVIYEAYSMCIIAHCFNVSINCSIADGVIASLSVCYFAAFLMK